VTILRKYFSNVGKRPDYVSRAGNTPCPIIPAFF